MKKKNVFLVMVICVLLFRTGCYTNLCVNFGNGTERKIQVKDIQTGQEIQIAPGKFRKLRHDQANLIVTTPDKTRFLFAEVKVVDRALDQKYYDRSKGLFGTWSIDLNVLLQTNMDLYVLLPCKKAVDTSLPQPDGYPKAGKMLTELTPR